VLCSIDAGSAATAAYYRTVMVYVVGSFCLAQFVVLLITWPQKLGHLRKPLGTSRWLVDPVCPSVLQSVSLHCASSASSQRCILQEKMLRTEKFSSFPHIMYKPQSCNILELQFSSDWTERSDVNYLTSSLTRHPRKLLFFSK